MEKKVSEVERYTLDYMKVHGFQVILPKENYQQCFDYIKSCCTKSTDEEIKQHLNKLLEND